MYFKEVKDRKIDDLKKNYYLPTFFIRMEKVHLSFNRATT